MKASTNKSWTQAYVLEPNDLEVLCARLSEKLSTIKFETENKDGIKRTFSTLDELLAFENPPKKDIRILRIISFSSDNSFLLRLDKDSVKNVGLVLDGNEDYVMTINEEVESRLAAMKPWYSLMAHTFFTSGLWLLFAIYVSINPIKNYLEGKISAETLLALPPIPALVILLLIGMVITWAFDRLRLAIFPMGVIAIGQGAKRHKDKEIIRTVVVVSFAISVIAGVITSLII